MDKEMMVLVCSTCGACDTEIMNELARLQNEIDTVPITIYMEECLDTCESEPSFVVDYVSIAPATPEKLRRAVNQALERRGKSSD